MRIELPAPAPWGLAGRGKVHPPADAPAVLTNLMGESTTLQASKGKVAVPAQLCPAFVSFGAAQVGRSSPQ